MFYGYAAAYFSPNAFDAAYNDFEARVREDGGTDYAPTHSAQVLNDMRENGLFTSGDLRLLVPCSAGKATVLYAMYVSKYPLYVDYIERILDDGGTVVRQAEVYNTYDDLDSAGVLADAFLWLSTSAGKATVLYSMDANTIVYDHEQRVSTDGGTTYLAGADARIVQQLIREDLYNESSIIVPCASGKATVLYSLIPN